MLKALTVATIALCLSGCMMTAEEIMARDDSTCRSWGVAPGTNPYVECRALLTQQRAMEDMQRRNNAAVLAGALLSR